jgi:uncharacterized membrane protein
MKALIANNEHKNKWRLILCFVILFTSAYFFLSHKPGNAAADNLMNTHNNISFQNEIQPILERRCVKCHGGDFPSEGLSMESYKSLMAGSQNGPVIIAGHSNNSLLFEKVESGEMPKRGSDLTVEEINLIKQWINEGASNN